MLLLGMTGPIGHGKTTFANALAKLEPSLRHLELNMPIIEVANAWQATLKAPFDPYDVSALNGWLKSLPAILLELLQVKCTFEQLKIDEAALRLHPVEYQKLILHAENLRRNFTLSQQVITNDNKEAYRPILQWLGGYLVARVDAGIWANEIVRRARQAEGEGCQLCIVGGLRYPSDAMILRQAGAIIVKIYRPGHLENDKLDPTERERESIPVDCTIMSNGAVTDVERFAPQFLQDVRAGKLPLQYQTVQA